MKQTIDTKATLYDENLNPTPLMSELIKDIRESGIYDVLNKYIEILSPHEIVGFISSDLHNQIAINIIKRRIEKNK